MEGLPSRAALLVRGICVAHPDPLPPPPGWTAPRATLIIAASPRSGSSWLASMARATGVMGDPQEWFGPWRTGAARDRTVAAAHEAAAGATPNGIAALKLFPHHLAAAQAHIRLFDWFPRAAWVHLVRRDLLGQAVSLWRADGSGAWKQKAAGPAASAPPYDAAAIESFLRTCAAYEADWRAFFARTGIEPLTLAYEEIDADPRAALLAIAARLGVAPLSAPTGDGEAPRIQRDVVSIAVRAKFRSERGDPGRPLVPLLAPARAVRAPRTAANLIRFLVGRPLRL